MITVCALGRGELVVLSGGQVLVAGGIDRVGALCSQTARTRKANATIPAGPLDDVQRPAHVGKYPQDRLDTASPVITCQG